jgi:hypothetical protein
MEENMMSRKRFPAVPVSWSIPAWFNPFCLAGFQGYQKACWTGIFTQAINGQPLASGTQSAGRS